jgi:hypothetical protein
MGLAAGQPMLILLLEVPQNFRINQGPFERVVQTKSDMDSYVATCANRNHDGEGG